MPINLSTAKVNVSNLPIWKAQYLDTIPIVFFLSGDPQTQTDTSKMKLASTANAEMNNKLSENKHGKNDAPRPTKLFIFVLI